MRGVVVVDKASGPTSHDVVRVARRVFGTRAVGHAGTLDPLASGVLVLGVGEGTKLLAHLTAADKAYEAHIRLGAQTDTLDAAGRVIDEAPLPEHLDRARVEAACTRFLGETLQRAPEISAIKQDGQPLYARVRRGEAVVAPERSVIVHSLAIDAVERDAIVLRVRCGKGFYVRALARDLAVALGTIGHLVALRRTQSGWFTLDGALPFETLLRASRDDLEARARAHAALMPLGTAVAGFPTVTVTAEGAEDIRHGRVVTAARVASGALPPHGLEPIAVLNGAGELVALGRSDPDGVHVLRGFAQSP